MIKEAIIQLTAKKDLDYETAKQVMNEIMSGEATEAQMGAFLTALAIKGETVTEITACAEVMRAKAVRLNPPFEVMDIVGTGGDGTGTFNISTTAAFIAAAGGVKVAKHGNRSMSSKSGAADCLEALGANISLSPEENEELLEKTGICFMFAQRYHSSMKYAAPVRRDIGIRTVFNILGPLSNPAEASMQIMGVYSRELAEPLAKVLSNLGVKRGMTVYGADGADEASVTDKTLICEIDNGSIKTYEITPEDAGIKRCADFSELKGGDGAENAVIAKNILSGKEKGAKRDVAVLNAALALYAGGKATDIKSGVKLAKELIDSGKAFKKLEDFSRGCAI